MRNRPIDWFMVAIFAGWFLVTTFFFVRALATRRWPRTDGVVLGSTIVRSQKGMYYPIVRYRYTQDGNPYEAERVSLKIQGYMTSAGAEKVVRRYSAQSRVAVYVDPKAPASAVLERGLGSPFTYIAAYVFFGLVVALPFLV